MGEIDFDPIVYRQWPLKVIHEAITEFNEIMHKDAEVEEIQAGLHCLDFLTRKSELDASTEARLSGAVTEANMRIELLLDKLNADKEFEDWRQGAIKQVEYMKRAVDRVLDNARRVGPDYVEEYVRKRIEERYK